MNESLALPYRLPQISPRAYEHPADRAATAALRAIPLLDSVIRRLTEYRYERSFLQMALGNSIQLGPNQLPHIWQCYLAVLDTLDMPQQYPLYITQTPFANAFTLGTKAPIIVMNSGLVNIMDETEVRAVLAHEVGHILSEHCLNRTALFMILQLSHIGGLPVFAGLPLVAIRLALLEWFRAAELSCDRAAALAVRDPLVFCRSLMNLAGGSSTQNLNLDAFIKQSMEYESWDNTLDKGMRFFAEIGRTHPFPVRRVCELMKWVQSGEFDRITSGDYIRRDDKTHIRQDVGDGVKFYTERFQDILGEASGGLNNFARQTKEWLKRNKDESKDNEKKSPDL